MYVKPEAPKLIILSSVVVLLVIATTILYAIPFLILAPGLAPVAGLPEFSHVLFFAKYNLPASKSIAIPTTTPAPTAEP